MNFGIEFSAVFLTFLGWILVAKIIEKLVWMGSWAALGRSWVGLGGVLWSVVWSCVVLGGLG